MTHKNGYYLSTSELSLKHNGNHLPSTPVAHAVHMKQLVNSTEYNKYIWYLCGGLKTIAPELHQGYTQYKFLM